MRPAFVTVVACGFGQLTCPTQAQSFPYAHGVAHVPEKSCCSKAWKAAAPASCSLPHACRQSGVEHARKQRQYESPSTEVPHARALLQVSELVPMQSWHPAAASGSLMYPATAPHGRAHSFSHFAARHALSAETLGLGPTGLSSVQCDRQDGSPLHLPRHDS
jgi:hypothetical protein